MKAKHFLIVVFLMTFIGVFSQITVNPVAVPGKPELLSYAAAEIKDLVVNNGFMLLNSTSGRINYYFNGAWYEVSASCVPQFSRPVIQSLSNTYVGVVMNMKEEATYRVTLLPDSVIYETSGRQISIKRPESFVPGKTYKLLVENLNDPCDNRYKADTIIRFTVNEAKKEYAFPVVYAGENTWMAEPLANYVEDAQVSLKSGKSVFYNWNTLNVDTFSSKKAVYYSKNICPSGFRIPDAKDVESLNSFFGGQNISDKFKIGKEGEVLIAATKQIQKTKAGSFFMLKDSDRAGFFQVMLLDGNEVRIGTMPRSLYMRILCVSNEK